MAKKDDKKSKDDKGRNKDDKEPGKKAQAKADAKAEKETRKQEAKAEKGAAKSDGKGKKGGGKGGAAEETAPQQTGGGYGTAEQGAAQAAPAAGQEPVDQVEVLKLALRDTEAKLVAAEHRLRQVQQQLEDERRALAEASTPTIEAQEAIVDAAVAETIAEAVVAAELAAVTRSADEPVSGTEAAAATLEEAAAAIDAALAEDSGSEGVTATTERPVDAAARRDAEAAFTGSGDDLTPPLPEEDVPANEEPSDSWTLVRLRKEAGRRGITGVSNLTKAALVQRLRTA